MHELHASGRARMNQKTKATSINMCSLVKQLFVKSLLIKRLKAFSIFIERGLCYTDYNGNSFFYPRKWMAGLCRKHSKKFSGINGKEIFFLELASLSFEGAKKKDPFSFSTRKCERFSIENVRGKIWEK